MREFKRGIITMLQSCFTKRRLCLVLVVLLVSCSCLSTIAFAATEKTPRLSASSHTFEYGGGAGRVNVYDANKVTVACPVSWVSVRTDTTQKYIQVVMNVGVNKGKARDATITVYTEKGTLKFKVYQKASGFSVFTPDGSVCTNFHIVGGTPTGEKLSYTFKTNAYGAVRVTSQASWLSASIEIPSKIIHITADLNLTGAVFAIVYIGLLGSFMVMLRLAYGIVAVVSMIIVTKLCDIGAYTVGRLIGRHKMAPSLSPGKTIEGGCGGVAFSILGAWFSVAVLFPMATGRPSETTWLGVIIYGVAVGISGAIGDLAESLIKRDVMRKDSGVNVPGFGGFLDIFDSLLVAAPVAFALWAFHVVQ